MGSNPVLFLPSHRSYADFILMAFVMFNYSVDIPCVAAGMGNYLYLYYPQRIFTILLENQLLFCCVYCQVKFLMFSQLRVNQVIINQLITNQSNNTKPK